MLGLRPSRARFLRYSAVGAATFGFDLLLLFGMVSGLGIRLALATPVAFLIAVSLNYFLSRRFVFSRTERRMSHGYAYFGLAAVLGALVTTLLTEVLVMKIGLFYLFARCLVAGIVGIGNYLFNLYGNFQVVGKH